MLTLTSLNTYHFFHLNTATLPATKVYILASEERIDDGGSVWLRIHGLILSMELKEDILG